MGEPLNVIKYFHMQPLVSIIIPFYNSASFIEDAVKSLENQSCDYEAIFVDDGSQDNGHEIIECYKAKNPRIKLIRQKNQGANRARANGVKEAKGEWIAFLDADDRFLPSFSEIVEKWNNSFAGDIVVTYNRDLLPTKEDYRIDIETYRKKIILGEIYTGPWSKLFRRKLFNDFVFDFPSNIISAEDYLMNIRLSLNTDSDIMITKDNYYDCRFDLNPQSAMKTFKGSWSYCLDYDVHFNNCFSEATRTKYLLQITNRRLSVWHNNFRKTWKLPKSAYECDYYRLLEEDIRIEDYPLSVYERLNMTLRNPVSRALADVFCRINGIISRIRKI